MDTFRLISTSITPVVLISACGLIVLALYNRLGAILARIRAIHQQKIELLGHLDKCEGGKHQTLLDMIDLQIAKVTIKAKTIQKGLHCLLFAILAFLLSSLLAAAAVLHDSVGVVAFGMHVSGVILFLAGVAWAIRELALSLTPLEEESAFLEILTAQRTVKSQDDQKLRAANAA